RRSLRGSLPPLSSVACFACAGAHRDLHSFPTRRSSDLRGDPLNPTRQDRILPRARDIARAFIIVYLLLTMACASAYWFAGMQPRSEEHTFELQSRENLVCRLLLEKKKTESSPTRVRVMQ